MRRFFADGRARLIEDALTLPILLLVTVAMLNVFLYGVASVSAANAAEYAARRASVAQANPAGVARAAAQQRLGRLPLGAHFAVGVRTGTHRGQTDMVIVTYAVPNWFRGLAAMFGVSTPAVLRGHAVSYFRHEGWR